MRADDDRDQPDARKSSRNRPVLGVLDLRCKGKTQFLVTKSGADPMSVTDARTDGRTDAHTSIFLMSLHNRPFGQKSGQPGGQSTGLLARFGLFLNVSVGQVYEKEMLKQPSFVSGSWIGIKAQDFWTVSGCF